jgi:predicted nuclease of predicted toxin-antitoxin system
MLRFAADENLNGHLLRGLRRRLPDLDVVRVQDTDVSGLGDPEVLAWAATEGRILLTHDVSSLTAAANERLKAGELLPGVIEVSLSQGLGRAIEELQLLAEAGTPEDCRDRVLYLP